MTLHLRRLRAHLRLQPEGWRRRRRALHRRWRNGGRRERLGGMGGSDSVSTEDVDPGLHGVGGPLK